MDYCKYVDVFYGNGEVDHYYDDGLASKWFYIKALCGNTTPHAVLPFGKMSVGSYSGGYPTGYGTHYPNCCGGIRKISDKMCVRGMSHLHHSGVGEMKYYYNYTLTTPFYDGLSNITMYHEVHEEKGCPGYYKVLFNDTECEVTVNETTAYHRYTFQKENGRLAVDFSNDGLYRGFAEAYRGYVKQPYVEIINDSMVMFSAIMSGVKLYFCVTANGHNVRPSLFENCDIKLGRTLNDVEVKNPFGVIFDFEGDILELKVSYSTLGFEQAKNNVLNSTENFDEVAHKTYDKWNEYLSVIDVDADEEIKRKLYSNLYHSLIKPVDMTGENVLGVSNETVVDFASFWDQYKTVFPLIFMLYPDMAEKITAAIHNISKTIGKISCTFGLSDIYPAEEQAKMLGILALCDGYYYGVNRVTSEIVDECIEREAAREDFKEFINNGTFEKYTHIIDAAQACASVASITKNDALKQKLTKLAENWKKAYDDDGLMSLKSWYYEGDRHTYSFRLHNNMEERIKLAGGKQRFAQLLDNLFGFGKDSIKPITYLDAYDDVCATDYRRFQGFNNESDMETPFAYIYADRHDRICEIAHECVTRSFTEGKGGLPGNNDSGGLSSLFVWYVLGLFPEAGNGKMLIGSPHIRQATIKLSNGNKLEIIVNNFSSYNYHVDNVEFNGCPIENYIIPVYEFMKGGKLVFEMK